MVKNTIQTFFGQFDALKQRTPRQPLAAQLEGSQGRLEIDRPFFRSDNIRMAQGTRIAPAGCAGSWIPFRRIMCLRQLARFQLSI